MIGSLFKAFTLLGSEWVLWLLLALSIWSLAIIIERFRNLRNQERLGALLWSQKISPLLKDAKVSEALSKDWSKTYPCVEAGLIDLVSRHTGGKGKLDAEELEQVASGYLMREKLALERNLAFLGTVGSNAPFIGLFGTVLGIIKAFNDMGAKVESSGAQVISIGISEALVATAVGLLVAIPAVVFFNFFQRKIKMILGRAESLKSTLIGTREAGG